MYFFTVLNLFCVFLQLRKYTYTAKTTYLNTRTLFTDTYFEADLQESPHKVQTKPQSESSDNGS